jgi:hypothetical protein
MASRPVHLHRADLDSRIKILGPVLGTIAAVNPDGRPMVQFEGSAMPVIARIAASLCASGTAPATGTSVILIFENGDHQLPVIVDLVRDSLASPAGSAAVTQNQGFTTSFELNGKRVVLEGKEEIVLKCGLGSLTLRADGQVVIKGTRLMSKASETNKVRGASVLIN